MVTVDIDKCVGCGECEDVCSFGAISIVDDKAVIDQDTCTLCGACAEACPEGAIEVPEAEESAAPGISLEEWKGVWVVAEIRNGKFAPVSFELLGKGRVINDYHPVSTSGHQFRGIFLHPASQEHC